ncbi:MAG TPA: prefoldin subunit alpha [Methanomassiliicoccales archaeon]|nr:prefoldin subunit alpha [Methanomassiliicoccales archaeon]
MNEEEIRQALAALDLYRAQAETLAEQQQIVQMSLEEYARARETLSKWKDASPGAEILVPIGGNSFVYSKVGTSDKALVGIGTGLTVERSTEEAIKTLDARITELTDGLKKITESRSVVESRAQQLTQMVQAEYEKLQQSQGR